VDPAQEELRGDIREAVQGVLSVVDRREFVRRSRSGEHLEDWWSAMASQGLLGVGVPESLGGSGGGISGPVAVMEALSEAGTPPVLYLLTSFARTAILRHGTPEQLRRWVAPTVTADVRLCFAITEADAGTNSFEMSTFARADGDRFLITGEKVFISAADDATHALVVARTTRRGEGHDRRSGLSLFVVPTDAPGLELQQMPIELHSPEHQFVVHLDDVEVPAEQLIGERDDGVRALFDALNPERLLVAAWAIGLGEHALRRGTDYARERAPFGKPIGSYQGVQHPLARARAHIDAARLMTYQACSQFDRDVEAGAYANMAKLLASEAASAAADAVIQAFGGSAFDQDTDITTLWPMIRLLRIAPLNNEMILNYIAERVLRLPKSY
jgi:acyl-CoA dehydrogenase